MVNTLINNPGTSHGATTLPSGGRKSNRRKKSMKKKGKTAKKRKTKKARKTRRRKGAGDNPSMGKPSRMKQFYRALHKNVRGKKSKGERNEIRAATANAAADKVAAYKAAADAKAKKDADYLEEIIRKDRSYTEMVDIADLRVDDTYVEYQGADIYPPLLPLGKFKEKVIGSYGGPLYGIPITVKFGNKELKGYFRKNAEMWLENNTSIKGLIFKVNSDAKEEDGEDKVEDE